VLAYMKYLMPALFKTQPLHLTLFVTNRCNARCEFCFYPTNRDVQQMSVEEYEALAEHLTSVLWLAFSGGEPTLRDDLPEIAKVLYKKTKPKFILISTNGFLPERIETIAETVLADCASSTVVFKVSIDAVGEEHDRLRGVNGAFDRAVKSIQLLGKLQKRYSNLQIGVNTVLSNKNIHSIGRTIEFINKLSSVEVHTLSLVRGPMFTQFGIDAEQYSAVMRAFMKRSKKLSYHFAGASLKVAQDIVRAGIIERVLRGHGFPFSCTAGKLSLVIAEDARVYPCEEFTVCIGNLRQCDYDINSLCRDEQIKEPLNKLKKCRCSHECNIMMNIIGSIRGYWMLAKAYSQLRFSSKHAGLFSKRLNYQRQF